MAELHKEMLAEWRRDAEDADRGQYEVMCCACPLAGDRRERTVNGAELIAVERQRQITEEGWTPEHDDEHVAGEMASAAACYADPIYRPNGEVPQSWPWHPTWWKPSADPVRNLVKAGALIAAEIDRLQRAAEIEGSDE